MKYDDQTITNAADFAKYLLEKEKVAIIPCQDFGAPDCIRLSYAMSEELIQKGLLRIKDFVSKLQA